MPKWCPRDNINREVRKESKTDMESATFETLETVEDLANIILFDVTKSTKRYFFTTIPVTPPDSPFREPISKPRGECFAPWT